MVDQAKPEATVPRLELVGFDRLTTEVLSLVLAGVVLQPEGSTAKERQITLTPLDHHFSEIPTDIAEPWVALLPAPSASLRQAAQRAGAIGTVSRSEGLVTLVASLRRAALGDKLDSGADAATDPLAGLSMRQLSVLVLVTSGASNAEMADRLGISMHTARTHVQNVLTKLGVHSRLSAAAIGRTAGLDRVKP